MERLSEANLGQGVLRADSLAPYFLSTICLLPDSEYNVTSHLKKIMYPVISNKNIPEDLPNMPF